jgi:hypothetical protein
MNSIDKVLGQWPSMADLGRDLGVPYSTVAAWKQRGSIPVSYWRGLTDAARSPAGLAEHAAPDREPAPSFAAGAASGHFSRWKHLRRSHFASMEEIVDHVRALRDEWDRR